MQPIELPTVDDIPGPFRAVCLSVALLIIVVILFNVKRASDTLKQQEKKRERKEKHDIIEQTIFALSTKVEGIKDNKVRKDLVHACELAFGFLEILRHSDYLGYVEEKFPVLLANMNRQVGSFIRHEGGRRPLSPDLYERIRTILLNYDNLFQKMQDNDPSVEELLTSIIDSDSAMVSTIGYLEN
ncbi:hypothetical protein A2572_00440 [Candidatus Collierbacteria bacterium RIFOXYD1_FULL_40_9]|uniref:Uncharacterized protein n=1 Tax=Candidatus Collierbacteria bacterium RIFOXYD1_FULL_40_9 TaxID=1817731 RepID=A0A1F5FWM7_9BACT|nr:MAG: hypothetical protein A2572_00440 [Candidatus Collierbacteria bacterium RIFOXYD1_FULL_40_9]